MAGTTVPLRITEKTQSVRVSLRTIDPSLAKVRRAEVAAYLEAFWRSLREDAPISLTHRQATALAGELYRSWTEGEDRERSHTVTIGFDGKFLPNEPTLPEEHRAVWAAVVERWEELGAGKEAADLEPHIGPLVRRLLSAKGITRVTPETGLTLLVTFWEALLDAFRSRKRNAEGDYSPDPKALRFPM